MCRYCSLGEYKYRRYLHPKILGTYSDRYDALCEAEGKLNRVPPAGTIQRAGAMRSPWLATGVAVAGVAVYYWLTYYKTELALL